MLQMANHSIGHNLPLWDKDLSNSADAIFIKETKEITTIIRLGINKNVPAFFLFIFKGCTTKKRHSPSIKTTRESK